ncbi:MAG: hypothetical protein OTJ45_05830 [Alphaproteobacteria bacterium]|nr:hypothetical protein [Alphaproteobacteria bacterium]
MTRNNPFADGCAHVVSNYVPIAQAASPIRDFGFLRPDATYDVIHI